MKPLKGYGRHNFTDTDGIKDKWAGGTRDGPFETQPPPPKSPAFHSDICELGKWNP